MWTQLLTIILDRLVLVSYPRDAAGSFIAAREESWKGLLTPKLAEALAIRSSITWLKSRRCDAVQIETDALLVFQGLHSDSLASSFDLVLEDVRKIAKDFSNISFQFVKRSANMEAHKLAREAVFIAGCREWNSFPPSIISDVFSSVLS